MKKAILTTLIVLASSLTVVGCQSVSRETVGTVGGGVGGGFIGSALTGGSTLGTVGGALGGAVIGHEVARSTRPVARGGFRR